MLSALATSTGSSSLFMIIWLVIIFAFMYFFMIRPQQKEQREKTAMLNDLAVGDTIMTTGGFYGVLIDIDEDTVIVEFGSNKNCRIPMSKNAIAQVEKPEDAAAAAKAEANKPAEEKEEKKGLFGRKK